MVSFRCLATAAVALFAAVPALSQATPQDVRMNIEALTERSQSLIEPAESLSLTNAPLVVVGQGPLPTIIFGFADIVATAGTAFVQMAGMPPIAPGIESDDVFEAFREFVRIHMILLDTLIGNAGLLTTVPFVGEPVAAVLRQIEMVVDTLAFALIDALEGREAEVQAEGDMLSATVEEAIQSFEGLPLLADATGDLPELSDIIPGVDDATEDLPLSDLPLVGSLPLVGGLFGGAAPEMPEMPEMAMETPAMSMSMTPTATGASAMPTMTSPTAPVMETPMAPATTLIFDIPVPTVVPGSSNILIPIGGPGLPSTTLTVDISVPTLVPGTGSVILPMESMPLDGSAFIIGGVLGEDVVCSCSNQPVSRVKRALA